MLRVRYDGGDCCGRHAPAASIAWTYWENEIYEKGKDGSSFITLTCVPFLAAGLARNPIPTELRPRERRLPVTKQNNRKCAMS